MLQQVFTLVSILPSVELHTLSHSRVVRNLICRFFVTFYLVPSTSVLTATTGVTYNIFGSTTIAFNTTQAGFYFLFCTKILTFLNSRMASSLQIHYH